VSVAQAMHEDANTVVSVIGRDNKAFGVRVGVHRGLMLSLPLRSIVTRAYRVGLPICANDLVLMAETEELLVEKIQKLKKVWRRRYSE